MLAFDHATSILIIYTVTMTKISLSHSRSVWKTMFVMYTNRYSLEAARCDKLPERIEPLKLLGRKKKTLLSVHDEDTCL